ncbi:hypothetical protein PG994_000111 [Apiospora phragmitis]|uniref:Uncharacterized protein n=1 Tax=Apiospora phragmitis TaxID=2905665 RepID=A0ABR1X598_9PEZI
MVLVGALVLLLHYRRGVRVVLSMSARILYVVPWLAAVLTQEAAWLFGRYLVAALAWFGRALYRSLRDWLVLPTARWVGRTFEPVVAGVFDVTIAAWAVYGAGWVLRRMFWYLASAGAFVGGWWALLVCIVSFPRAPSKRERVVPRVYWVRVAVFTISAVYVAMWLPSLYFSPSPSHSTDPKRLSFMEKIGRDPELDPQHVVVRTVRDALGNHIDDRRFAFDVDRCEKRYMDWFVDSGYVLRPCKYPNCMIPTEEEW